MSNRCYQGFGKCNSFWVDRPTFGWTYLETNYAYRNVHYVEISTVGQSTRMHCIYQNLDNVNS